MKIILRALGNKFFLSVCIANLLSYNLQAKTCSEHYQSHFKEDKAYKKAQKADLMVHDSPEALATIFSGSKELLKLPNKTGFVLLKKTVRTIPKGPHSLFLVGATLVVPLVMIPFTTAGAVVLPIVGVPAVGAFAAYQQTRVTKSYKKAKKLMKFMATLDRYKISTIAPKTLVKFVEDEELEAYFEDREEALAQLKKAYELNFFCQQQDNEVHLMTRKEIVKNIENGSLQNFLSEHSNKAGI